MNLGLKKTVISLVMLFTSTLAMPLFAQQPTLPKNTNGYYIIKSDADYETFRQIVATGNPYANAVLEADITVVNPIGEGDEQFHYRGTFDGRGHTVRFSDEKNYYKTTTLFEYTKPGCVIRNLKVTGEVYNKDVKGYTGSIVNDATGTVLQNCISDAIVNSGNRGGLVGIARGVCFLENCAYIGLIPAMKPRSGLVGVNEHNVKMKSCYVAPDFGQYHEDFSVPNFFTDKMDEGDVCLNNYYTYTYLKNTTPVPLQSVSYATKITDEDLSSGKLCYMLNKNGRKGVVWYQNGKYPYPFKVEGSKLITSTDSGETFRDDIAECSHEFENQICAMCGAIESKNIEPLQNRQFTSIDNIDYELFDDGTAAVKGLVSRAVKAVHIPETINFKGEDFVVTRIESYALVNSDIEYCFIPRTVTRTGANTFMGCKKLKYLHIADALPNSTSSIKLYPTTFEDCALEKIYVGKNVKWDIDGAYGSVPFKDKTSITDIYWGPHVAHIASEVEAPRLGNYELFEGCTGVQRVYFMGNDNSLGKDLAVLCGAGMSNAKELYINRNIKGLIDENGTIDYDGLYNGKEKVVYGPYVKSITDNTFKGSASLKTVNFDHAYNLDAIGAYAFRGCVNLADSLNFSNTKITKVGEAAFAGSGVNSATLGNSLKTIPVALFKECENLSQIRISTIAETIGEDAFAGCVGLITVSIPGSVTSIGKNAFAGCGKLRSVRFEDGESVLPLNDNQFKGASFEEVFLGRTITGNSESFQTKSGSIWTIGPKVTNLYKSYFPHDSYDAILVECSSEPLHFDDYFVGGPVAMILDRVMVCDKDDMEALPFKAKGKTNTLTLGDSLSRIPAKYFEGYTGISYVLVPANVKEIGKEAFKGCPKLKVASILGEPTIAESAFAGCSNFKYLYLMGKTVKLADKAFTGCPIVEVTTAFDGDPGEGSSEYAFDDKTYNSANLANADNLDITYTSNPWKKFQHASSTIVTEFNHGLDGDFDRASLPHKFPNGRFDLIYMPFNMDSYYFGSDAEIWKMNIDGARFLDELIRGEEKSFFADEIRFEKVNIDKEKSLVRDNVYLVKCNHEEESMGAYFNLFNESKVHFDNSGHMLRGEGNFYLEMHKGEKTTQICREYDGYYVVDEGVIKFVNGDFTAQSGSVVFRNTRTVNVANNVIETIYRFLSGNDKLLATSKIDLSFEKSLGGYASFYDVDYNYIAPDWISIYVVTSTDGTSIEMEEIADRVITKGQAVLLKSSNEDKLNSASDLIEHLTYATHGSTSSAYDRNLLKGLDEDKLVNELSDDFVYVLGNDGENIGLYKVEGDEKVAANKAYLDPKDIDTGLWDKDCLLCGESEDPEDPKDPTETTGVVSTLITSEEVKNKTAYDLMGRRLKEAGFSGIYIVNGQKVIVK